MITNVKPTCIITGGNGAIGSTISKLLDEQMLVLSPDRNTLDVCSTQSVTDYFSKKPSPELLICSAGITRDALISKMSHENWDSVMDTNLTGVFRCAQAAVKKMLKDTNSMRKHIILIGSMSGSHPPAGQTNYSAAKAGLTGFTKSLAQELGARNIRVNLILPGWIDDTNITNKVSEKARILALKRHTLGSFNTSKEVALFIQNLHFHMRNTSGQVFNLDSRIL